MNVDLEAVLKEHDAVVTMTQQNAAAVQDADNKTGV
jgi:hypothetical protein